ncbi:15049_t:CDS:2, partial [Racocetra fulgida]
KYLPSFEIGFNTGGFDWNFMLKKIYLLNIEKEINIDEKMQRKIYGIESSNRNIKVNPTETMICEYYHLPGTIFIDLLVWAKKTFPTEIKNTLDVVLKRCELLGKVDLPYIPDSSEDLRCMFVYINAIKFKNNFQLLTRLAEQLSNLTKISVEK